MVCSQVCNLLLLLLKGNREYFLLRKRKNRRIKATYLKWFKSLVLLYRNWCYRIAILCIFRGVVWKLWLENLLKNRFYSSFLVGILFLLSLKGLMIFKMRNRIRIHWDLMGRSLRFWKLKRMHTDRILFSMKRTFIIRIRAPV